MAVSYPYDDTGKAPSNLVKDETQTLSPANDLPYRWFIPTHAPFYLTNLELQARDALGRMITLVEGVHFYAALDYFAATKANGDYVYGAIFIVDRTLQGPIYLRKYQCLGGKYSADRNYVANRLAEHNYNPREKFWDEVTSIQEQFPPSSHPQDIDTFTRFTDLIASVNGVAEAISATAISNQPFLDHLNAKGDPHETLNLLPTDLVRVPAMNTAIATRINQAVVPVQDALNLHTGNLNDPHRSVASVIGSQEAEAWVKQVADS